MIADYIKDNCPGSDVEGPFNLVDLISDAQVAELFSRCDQLLLGAPTWNTGADTQRSMTSWDGFLYDTLPAMDMKGKKVAIFGTGDQVSYPDNFCDAVGEIHDCFQAQGATMLGHLDVSDEYTHEDSKSVRDGRWCGLVCDEDNQSEMSEERASAWVTALQAEGMSLQ